MGLLGGLAGRARGKGGGMFVPTCGHKGFYIESKKPRILLFIDNSSSETEATCGHTGLSYESRY